MRTFAKRLSIVIGLGFLAALFQNFTVSGNDAKISATPNVCHIEAGFDRCTVDLEWSSQAPDACLFVKDGNMIACAQNGRRKFSFVTEAGTIIELRQSKTSTNVLVSIPVVGIRVSTTQSADTFKSKREERFIKATSFSSGAVSWDGRLFFSPVPQTKIIPVVGAEPIKEDHGTAWIVRALRPQKFKKDVNPRTSFSFPEAFSKPFLLDSDYLAPQLAEDIRQSNKTLAPVQGLDRLGRNDAKIKSRGHIAVYPHPKYRANPFFSDALGNPNRNGGHLTYYINIISSPMGLGDDDPNASAEDLNGEETSANEKRHLTLTEARAIVKNTDLAEIVSIEIIKAAVSLKTYKNGKYEELKGYEPTVSLDGRLIVWSGYPLNSSTKGFAVYTYNSNPLAITGWSNVQSITEMWHVHGPGRDGGEVDVAGKPFSERFPFAKYQMKDDRGTLFPSGLVIRGSYPWLTLDASDIIISTMGSTSYQQRAGTVIVGARTMGKIRYIDSAVNPIRGNPQNTFDGIAAHEQPRIFSGDRLGRYDAFKTLYKNLLYPSNPESIDAEDIERLRTIPSVVPFENIIFAPLFVTPGSWNAFADLSDPPLPHSRNKEVIGGFFNGSDRYVEIPFTDNLADLILALPMNESLEFRQDLLLKQAQPETEHHFYSGKMVKILRDQTPDLSQYSHTGKLENGAQFPFEFNNTSYWWERTESLSVAERVLRDKKEGALGNSVFMKPGSHVRVTLKEDAIKRVTSIGKYTVSFWIRSNDTYVGNLFSWPGFLKVKAHNGKLTIDHAIRSATSDIFQTPAEISESLILNLRRTDWTHVAVRYDGGQVEIYINGKKSGQYRVIGALQYNSTLSHDVIIGPALNECSTCVRVDMDEVQIAAAALSLDDIQRLAQLSKQEAELANATIAAPKAPFALELVRKIPENNSYVKEEALLGKELFNSKILSKNNTVSCATCHRADKSFADGLQLSTGIGTTGRNTPAILNKIYSTTQFWDGSAPTLESQVLHPILNGSEMSLGIDKITSKLIQNSSFQSRFNQVYARNPDLTLIARSLASYVRSITTDAAPFDSPGGLSESAIRGKQIFFHRANCIACHSGPLFTDEQTHDIGLLSSDLGKYNSTKKLTDMFAMKTPSLRNVAQTAPYFHDGSAATLRDVIDFYDRGGDQPHSINRPGRSLLVRPLGLSDVDKVDIINFLESLTGPVRDVSSP